jgi:hypothetical protein
MYLVERLDDTPGSAVASATSSPLRPGRRLCRIPLRCLPLEEHEIRLRLLAGFPAVLDVRVSPCSSVLLVVCVGAETVDAWIDAVADLLEEIPSTAGGRDTRQQDRRR